MAFIISRFIRSLHKISDKRNLLRVRCKVVQSLDYFRVRIFVLLCLVPISKEICSNKNSCLPVTQDRKNDEKLTSTNYHITSTVVCQEI